MSAITDIAREQLEQILEEIATCANTVDDLCSHLHDSASRAVLVDVVRQLTQRTGWMADLALAKLTGEPQIRGDAEDWLMPPAYRGIVRQEWVGASPAGDPQ